MMRRSLIFTVLRHLLSILVLPGTVTVLMPVLILHSSHALHPGGAWAFPLPMAIIAAGVSLAAGGLVLMLKSISLFAKVGKGTLAPWDPTEHLVIQGVYRYVRNPMISGVIAILLGETVFFFSRALLFWSACFIVFNLIFIPLEELGLAKKFGEDYRKYRDNVPRWIPRLKPWEQESGTKAGN